MRLTAPATATFIVLTRGKTTRQITVDLPAGQSLITLPKLSRVEHDVMVQAVDFAGGRARDRYRIYPRGWLPMGVAGRLAESVAFTATDWASSQSNVVQGCTRLGAARVDCRIARESGPCDRVIAVRLVDDSRLSWGMYGCPVARSPRYLRRPRSARSTDTVCALESDCDTRLVGWLSAADLAPWG